MRNSFLIKLYLPPFNSLTRWAGHIGIKLFHCYRTLNAKDCAKNESDEIIGPQWAFSCVFHVCNVYVFECNTWHLFMYQYEMISIIIIFLQTIVVISPQNKEYSVIITLKHFLASFIQGVYLKVSLFPYFMQVQFAFPLKYFCFCVSCNYWNLASTIKYISKSYISIRIFMDTVFENIDRIMTFQLARFTH